MKRVLNICLLLLCWVAYTGCSNDDDPQASIEVVDSMVNFSATGGEGHVNFSSSLQVQAEVNVDWCFITEVSPGKVLFNVAPNTAYMGRNAVLTVKSGSVSQRFNISQAGAVFAYNPDEWLLRTSNEAATLPVELYGSYACEVEIPEDAAYWLSFQQNEAGRTAHFVVKKNTTGKMRAAVVKVNCGGRKTEYQIIQYDMDNLLGDWDGQFISLGGPARLEGVHIAREEDGSYTLSNLFPGMPLTLKAYEKDNCLAFPAGQHMGTVEGQLHVSFQLIDQDMRFVRDPSQSISLGPLMLQDGSFALAFGGVKESDPFAFAVRLYADKDMTQFLEDLLFFINCMLYRN